MSLSLFRQARARRAANRQRGVTLVELMIALTLSSVVAAAVLTVLSSGAGLFRDAEANADMQGNLRFAIDRMSRELRVAGLNASANGVVDPFVLGGASANWVAIKRNASGIYAYGATAPISPNHGGDNAGFPVESITILGNFSNFSRQLVYNLGPGGDITLVHSNDPSDPNYFSEDSFVEMYRLGSPVSFTTRNGIFFGTVGSLNFNGALGPVVQMTPAPTAFGVPTGFSANESMLAPLRFVRYSIQVDPTDAKKTDLVRELLHPDGTTADYGRRQVIAEYVVGMHFNFCKDLSFAYGSAFIGATTSCDSANVEPISTNPQQLRAVTVQLWMRGSNETQLAKPSWAGVGDMPEIGFNLIGDTTMLARVRSIQASAGLPNLIR